VEQIRADLEAERSTDEDFHGAVVSFLALHPANAQLAGRLARADTDDATPVGSGTVARTKRIPVEQRAEAAVIAWLRHQTTGYDGMVIPRVKGNRREVRRMLAQRSQELWERYRRGEPGADGWPCLARRLTLSQPRDGSGHGEQSEWAPGTEDGDVGETRPPFAALGLWRFPDVGQIAPRLFRRRRLAHQRKFVQQAAQFLAGMESVAHRAADQQGLVRL
jgi:hypothetical protein